jgi:hypothetical protein
MAKGTLELLTLLEHDNDFNDAVLEGDMEATGRLWERTPTCMAECMLMVSLLLSESLPGHMYVDGLW